jgi:aspartate racemase
MLGIIGGAGVAATNLLQTRIEELFTLAGAFRDSHHPEILSFQATQAPSRSMYLEGNGESFVPQYQDIARQLELAGATLIAMCCNTAHANYADIANAVSVPFIHLINETTQRVAKSNVKKVGLIASHGCVISNIYQTKMTELCKDKELLIPSIEQQSLITKAIVNIKSSRRFSPTDSENRPRNTFQEVVNSFQNQGCDAIILGCTDIAVDFSVQNNHNMVYFDSLQILADSIFQKLMQQLPGNTNAMQFYNGLSSRIQVADETKNKTKDGSSIDIEFILSHATNKTSLLDLGSGTGLIINRLVSEFDNIVAVEKFPNFSKFIHHRDNLITINEDLLSFQPKYLSSTVTIFACLNYFNFYEASAIYRTAWHALLPGGKLIIKHQMGINETVVINRVSEDLGQYYFSQYRTLSDEKTMIALAGFKNILSFDIYPADFNPHTNTHYYAITADKY